MTYGSCLQAIDVVITWMPSNDWDDNMNPKIQKVYLFGGIFLLSGFTQLVT